MLHLAGPIFMYRTLIGATMGYSYRIGTLDGVVNRQKIFSHQVILSADGYYLR